MAGPAVRARGWFLTPTGALRAGPQVLLSLVGIALALGLTIAYVHRVDERRAASDRAARVAQQRAAEQTKAVVCSMILANVQVYDETPPQTAAGRNLAESWNQLKAQLGC